MGLKGRFVNALLEFGGLNLVVDRHVPEGWTKKLQSDQGGFLRKSALRARTLRFKVLLF